MDLTTIPAAPDVLVDMTGIEIPDDLKPDPKILEEQAFWCLPQSPRLLRNIVPNGMGRIHFEEYLNRIRRAQMSGMKSLLALANTEKSEDWRKPSVCCVVGGGPSLQDKVGDLRHLIKRGASVLAVNKSHDWLLHRGLRCDYAALLDPKEWVADYINLSLAQDKATRKKAGKHWAEPKYLIASQCHDKTLDKFKSHPRAYLWHAAAGVGESEVLREEFANQDWINVAGASVIGLRAVMLAHILGFREIHLFGIDGSLLIRPDGSKALYSYHKPHIDPTWMPFDVTLTSGWTRTYYSNHHMARSTYEFEDCMRQWDGDIQKGNLEPFNVRVHGNPEHSAIAMVAAGMGIHADPRENEKYGRAP